MSRVSVGVLADDMTGALDAAVRFAPVAGAVPLQLDPARAGPEGSVAVSSGTRECPDERAAKATVARLLGLLEGRDLAFKKIDSLLRGHVVAEIEAVLEDGHFRQCLVAPAFPEQGRVTRGGRQWLLEPGVRPRPVGPDLVAAFARRGIEAALAPRGPAGLPDAPVVVADAETDEDLAALAASAGARTPRAGRRLFCGTAGLALALAGSRPRRVEALARPVLVVVGSPHPVSARQLEHLEITAGGAAAEARTEPVPGPPEGRMRRLRIAGAGTVLSFDLGEGLDRAAADRRVGAVLHDLLPRATKPETVVVVGGETLALVASAVGATGLATEAEYAAGIPVSRIVGGPWAGTALVSKSGAFGDDAVLSRMLGCA